MDIILLDSFLDQAIHKFLDKLMLHVRMDRDPSSTAEELDDLQPSFMAMCSLAGKLWIRTIVSEQQLSESTGIRLHMYNFLSICFANFFKPRTSSGDSGFGWTLARPNSSPKEVVEMFLSLSSKISQFSGGNKSEPKPSLKPGESWYSMLLFLLAQLSISKDQKEPIASVLEAFKLVDPFSSAREELHPSLWISEKSGSSAVSKFDDDWTNMYSQVESQQTDELCELYPPPRFCKMMEVYLRSVAKLLEPPVLDLYYNMRESSDQLPPAFFESPQDTLANHLNSYHSPALEQDSVIMESDMDASSSRDDLAKYSERISRSIIRHGQDIWPPPALDFSKLQPKQDNERKVASFGDGMTTPTNQVEKPKYISNWDQGDIEGGGRPHRRRSLDYHGDSMVDYTPPPQTLLSPRNLAAAQERNKDATIEELLEREANGDIPISVIYDGQVTPENQIGSAADPMVKSASRYVESRREGDTEGGGRKRRKHHPPGGPIIPRIFNK